MKKLILILTILSVALLAPSLDAEARAAGTRQHYAFNYDFWFIDRESPSPYLAERVLMGVDLGIGNFRDPQGVFVGGIGGERIYVVDTGNNRIVELDSSYNLTRVIYKFNYDGVDTFNNPHGVYVDRHGDIYVADTGNQRVVHINDDLDVVKILYKPDDALMNEIAEFLPTKVVVDNADRIFLLARNVNRGIMEFDVTGSFTGYIGANKVNFSVYEMIWKTLSFRAQREQMMLFVPTEYNNIFLDHKGFIYTTTSFFTESDLIGLLDDSYDDTSFVTLLLGIGESSNVEPIRRLNPMGEDILIRNGWISPIGDIDWSDAGGVSGPSRLVDIVSNKQDTYFVIDRVRGRIFAYDFQGNQLFIFGGLGNRAGYFQLPTGIEYLNGTLLVTDARSGGLTIFNPTEYGRLIHQAMEEYINGNYLESGELWEQVLVLNANFDMAYTGIGRALMRQDRFREAMDYFAQKFDRPNYSKAFRQYRKQVIEENIVYVMVALIVLIGFSNIRKLVKKIRSIKEEIG